MSIEGIHVAWLELTPAPDGFYERTGEALLESQRLDEDLFVELDAFVGLMLDV